jgi:type IV pilus assembly protein PilO
MLKNLNPDITDNMKYVIGLIAVIILSAICLIFLVLPLNRDRKVQDAKLTEENKRLAVLETFAGQNQNYDALVKIQNMKVAAAHKKIPDTVSVEELLNEYNKVAEATGVQLLGIAPSKATKTANAYVLPINVSLQGDYFRLITFLQQVENGDRFVQVQGAEYGSQANGADLKMKANFVVYALKKVEGAPVETPKANDAAAARQSIAQRNAAVKKAVQ